MVAVSPAAPRPSARIFAAMLHPIVESYRSPDWMIARI